MTSNRYRVLLVLSAAVVLVVAIAWFAWPDAEPRADLRAVRPIASTTSSTSPVRSTVAPTAPQVPPTASTTAVPPPLVSPARVRIPSIGLDAAIVPVGLEANGLMQLPPATDVGWYRLGPTPGQLGSAVLAAHVDYAGRRGAFFDLRSVAPGAEVIVEGDGTSRRFLVSTREQVAKASVQLGRYFTADGPARLTLITCGGVFDRGIGHYRDNIIITADLAP